MCLPTIQHPDRAAKWAALEAVTGAAARWAEIPGNPCPMRPKWAETRWVETPETRWAETRWPDPPETRWAATWAASAPWNTEPSTRFRPSANSHNARWHRKPHRSLHNPRWVAVLASNSLSGKSNSLALRLHRAPPTSGSRHRLKHHRLRSSLATANPWAAVLDSLRRLLHPPLNP